MTGLLIDSLDVDDPANGYAGELIQGGPDELAEYVGEDDDIPGASGQDPGLWTPSIRTVRYRVDVWGDGATVGQRRASYYSRMTALRDKMTPDDLITLRIEGDSDGRHFGLGAGEALVLSNVRPLSVIGEPVYLYEIRRVVLTLKCIDSPPDWVPEESP